FGCGRKASAGAAPPRRYSCRHDERADEIRRKFPCSSRVRQTAIAPARARADFFLPLPPRAGRGEEQPRKNLHRVLRPNLVPAGRGIVVGSFKSASMLGALLLAAC